ncbi:MAG: NUDIX hydrolase [Olegusella sp.]|nr:NUDIX hydrolase [Olegusella sp.]
MIDEIRRLLETPDPALAERVVSAERPWHGKIYDVETDDVVCPDGSHGYREIARHHGGAGVAAVKDGKICLVRQWRVAAGRMTLEIPAGRLDEGETPDVCAARELSEETGYVADRVELVAHSMGAIGFTDECTHVYRAIGLRKSDAHPDEGEFVGIVWLPVCDVVEAIHAGLIRDSKTIVAAFDAALRMAGEGADC